MKKLAFAVTALLLFPATYASQNEKINPLTDSGLVQMFHKTCDFIEKIESKFDKAALEACKDLYKAVKISTVDIYDEAPLNEDPVGETAKKRFNHLYGFGKTLPGTIWAFAQLCWQRDEDAGEMSNYAYTAFIIGDMD